MNLTFNKTMFISLLFAMVSVANDRIEIGVDEQLGSKIPLDLIFNDEEGNEIALKNIITGPTVLSLVYFNCPGICNPLLFELANVIYKSDLEPGYDYNVISISIDELENSETALTKKNEILSGIDKEVPSDSWRFLTGSLENVNSITNASGFYFKKDGKEFRHAGVLIFIDKDGKICRYLFPGYTEKRGYGILPFDFKMAVLETSKGKEAPTIARFLRFCFSYDTQGQKYVLNFTRIFGVVILLSVGIFFLVIRFKPKKEILKSR